MHCSQQQLNIRSIRAQDGQSEINTELAFGTCENVLILVCPWFRVSFYLFFFFIASCAAVLINRRQLRQSKYNQNLFSRVNGRSDVKRMLGKWVGSTRRIQWEVISGGVTVKVHTDYKLLLVVLHSNTECGIHGWHKNFKDASLKFMCKIWILGLFLHIGSFKIRRWHTSSLITFQFISLNFCRCFSLFFFYLARNIFLWVFSFQPKSLNNIPATSFQEESQDKDSGSSVACSRCVIPWHTVECRLSTLIFTFRTDIYIQFSWLTFSLNGTITTFCCTSFSTLSFHIKVISCIRGVLHWIATNRPQT